MTDHPNSADSSRRWLACVGVVATLLAIDGCRRTVEGGEPTFVPAVTVDAGGFVRSVRDGPVPVAEQVAHARITVTIDAAGAVTVEGRPTTIVGLPFAMRATSPGLDARVVIAADRSAAHARVVEVIDAARGAGYTHIAIAVAPSP